MHEDTLKHLGLDVDLIRRDLDASSAIADATEKKFWESRKQEDKLPNPNQALIAAAYFRRAGAHALLLSDLNRSDLSFLGATRMYDTLDVPYGALVVSLSQYQFQHHSHVRNLFKRQKDGFELTESAQRQQVYILLAYASDQESLNDLTQLAIDVRRDIEVYRSYPMGVLGIPLGVLLDIVDALAPQLAIREIRPEEAFTPLISIYSSSVRSAMNNHYHWQRLAMPFHPAEPDIFAVFGLAKNWLQKEFNFNLLQLIENYPMPKESQEFLFGVFRDLPQPRNPQDDSFQ